MAEQRRPVSFVSNRMASLLGMSCAAKDRLDEAERGAYIVPQLDPTAMSAEPISVGMVPVSLFRCHCLRHTSEQRLSKSSSGAATSAWQWHLRMAFMALPLLCYHEARMRRADSTVRLPVVKQSHDARTSNEASSSSHTQWVSCCSQKFEQRSCSGSIVGAAGQRSSRK